MPDALPEIFRVLIANVPAEKRESVQKELTRTLKAFWNQAYEQGKAEGLELVEALNETLENPIN